MKTWLGKLSIVAVAALLLAGCGRHDTVYNVDNATVATATGKTLSMEQVRDAIIASGGSLGWVMQAKGAGKLTATLRLRKHVAEVDIDYTTNSFSITYVNSTNLNYEDGKIHTNYNGWVMNLQNQIAANISML